jgi:hypothetical protein
VVGQAFGGADVVAAERSKAEVATVFAWVLRLGKRCRSVSDVWERVVRLVRIFSIDSPGTSDKREKHPYVVKVKDIHQVGHVVATPLCQLLAVNTFESIGGSPLFDKHDMGTVIGVLDEDLAPTSPGRDDIGGNTVPLNISVNHVCTGHSTGTSLSLPGPTGTQPNCPYGSSIHSPAVPFGGTIGTTWSPQPPTSAGNQYSEPVVPEVLQLTIVGDEQGRLLVRRTVRDGIYNLFLEPGPVAGQVRIVLGQLCRTDDVADLGESSLLSILVELGQAGIGVSLLHQSRAIGGILILLKVGQHVVFEVVKILIHLPAHSGFLQVLGECLPGERIAVEMRRLTTYSTDQPCLIISSK